MWSMSSFSKTERYGSSSWCNTSPLFQKVFGFCVLNLYLVPINGFWTQWTQWTSCSKTCGGGERTRTRKCITGSRCIPRDSSQTEKCNTFDCTCVSWTEWSQCSTNCTRSRIRTCHGQECASVCLDENTETDICLMGKGCSDLCDYGFRFWLPWSSWSACEMGSRINKTCGPEAKRVHYTVCEYREDSLCTAKCTSRRSQYENCTICCEQDGQWNSWSAFSPCSVTCGQGIQTRIRTCSSQACFCAGPAEDTLSCTEPSCPEGGIWGPWKPWSKCSQMCGGGTRSRQRNCSNHCCDGFSRDIGFCNMQSCTCDAAWGSWLEWSTCSTDCTSQRARRCLPGQASAGCSTNCSGHSEETNVCADCQLVNCSQENVWSSYSSCSVSCGFGIQNRSRICNSSSCPCTEPLTESLACYEGVCPASSTAESSILVISASLIGSIAVLFIGGFLGYVCYKQRHIPPTARVQNSEEKSRERGYDGSLPSSNITKSESSLKSFSLEGSSDRYASSLTESSSPDSSEESKADSEN